jgi:DNA-binding GntR family transcriptional regulator
MTGTLTREPSTKKLSQQIYELLKKDIVECRLEPGELLEEASMSERYAIGRTPFREACQRLEAAGLVEIVPHRGAFVASFSSEDIDDLFELRMIVEPAVAELACQRSSGSGLEALAENVAEWGRLTKMSAPSLVPQINLNSKNFHLGVARLTRNKELMSAIENMHDKLMRIIVFSARRSPPDYPFNAVHPEIFEAIGRGNSVEARDLMTKDVKQAREWIRNFGR